jgi:poly(3-hydroxybutyrate) depolymerase
VIVHGLDDPIVPFNGGSTKRAPDRRWVSVPQSAAYWVRANGAATDPKVEMVYGSRITRRIWTDGKNGADVLLYEIEGWDHRWPGARDLQQLPEDDARRDFDAATVIWRFFESCERARP